MYLQIPNECKYLFYGKSRKILKFFSCTVYANQRALSPALLDLLYIITIFWTRSNFFSAYLQQKYSNKICNSNENYLLFTFKYMQAITSISFYKIYF